MTHCCTHGPDQYGILVTYINYMNILLYDRDLIGLDIGIGVEHCYIWLKLKKVLNRFIASALER